MKKTKPTPAATSPVVETFGGDYHKCESIFPSRNAPPLPLGSTKLQRPLATTGKRKRAQVRGT